jgi:hypothetical protein
MRFGKTLIRSVALLSLFTATIAAEDSADAASSVETLGMQLLEVQSKEADLEARAKQLDEDLKPENIARAFAGIGSTKPDELRELRRRQLTIQRDSVRAQLNLLAKSRERLESVIRAAETQAYQQSAETVPPLNQMFAAQNAGSVWRLGMFIGLMAVGALVVVLGIARRAYVFGKYSSSRRSVAEHRRNYAR